MTKLLNTAELQFMNENDKSSSHQESYLAAIEIKESYIVNLDINNVRFHKLTISKECSSLCIDF